MWNPHCGWCSDHQHLASFMTSAPPQAPLPLWPNCSSKTSSPGECQIRTAWCTKLWMDLVIPTAGLLRSKNGSAWGGGGGLKDQLQVSYTRINMYLYLDFYWQPNSGILFPHMLHQLWQYLPSGLHQRDRWKNRPYHDQNQWSFN